MVYEEGCNEANHADPDRCTQNIQQRTEARK